MPRFVRKCLQRDCGRLFVTDDLDDKWCTVCVFEEWKRSMARAQLRLSNYVPKRQRRLSNPIIIAEGSQLAVAALFCQGQHGGRLPKAPNPAEGLI